MPELRFPEFCEDWEVDRIDRFLDRYVNPVDVQLETEYKQIGIRSHGKGIFHKAPVTGEKLGSKRVYWVHSEAFAINIVFAWEQAVALTSSEEEGYIASHRFLMFLPKENRVDLKFVLLFFLRKRGKYLLELASPGGAGRNKTLGQENFAELKITLPQKGEQKKIVSLLDTVDARLTQLRRKHKLLQTYKRGVMQKIFSQEIRFKQDNGSPFPQWRKEKLGNVADVRDGTHESPHYRESGFPLITSKNLSDSGIMDLANVNYISELDYKTINKRSKVSPGDILFGMIGTIGNPVLVDIAGFAIKNVALIKEQEVLQNKFLIYYLRSALIARQFYEQNTGGTQKFIALGVIRSLEVLVPHHSEQKRIADFLFAIDQKSEAMSCQIARVEKFRKGLLQKMFV